MRKFLKILFVPTAFAVLAGAGIATTAAPAKADLVLSPYFPFLYATPNAPPGYYYAPGYYNYAPNCYWDAFYGRVCY